VGINELMQYNFYFLVFFNVCVNNIYPFKSYLSKELYAGIVGIPIYLFIRFVAPS